ncbi:MAG TPA: ABC transporter substrate-binding protein [candidate division Zixibacteria bacterium]|nr:ABC transporter substrate-binding protein [candidate division Zixibacteria bacterium]
MNRLGSLSLLLAALLLAPPVALAQKTVVAWTAVSALNGPYWVMKEGGFLRQEGLDVDLIYIPSSQTVAQAMLAGEVAVSAANSQVVADTGLQGGDLVSMGAIINVVAFYIMAVPEIQKVEDLRGKAVGVTRFGASTDFGLRMLLSKYGLTAGRDVPVLQIGGMPEIAGALSKRAIYAAPMSYPMAYVAQQAGVKMLANLAKEDIPFMHVGLTTTRKFLRERRPQAKALIRAYGRAVHFMHTRKEETKAIFARYTKVTDPGMLEGSLQYAHDFVEKVPLVKAKAFQVTLEQIALKNPKAKQARPEDFFDNSLVQELIKEGFFTALWGKTPS